ncbi:hypothetical protein AAMO2058_000521200 [Amorphochlora amoebiformis]
MFGFNFYSGGGVGGDCLERTRKRERERLYRRLISCVNYCCTGGKSPSQKLLEIIGARTFIFSERSPNHKVRRKRVGFSHINSAGLSDSLSSYRERQKPCAVILMGLPGSGKSTVKTNYFHHMKNIDPDEIKSEHESWSASLSHTDPKLDRKIHVWSVRTAVNRLRRSVKRKEECILDASGSDCLWLKDQIETAKDEGFYVMVVYVVVPLEIALRRNRARIGFGSNGNTHATSRDSKNYVPESVLKAKAKCMQDSFSRARRYADEVWAVINFSTKEVEKVFG